VREFLSAIHLGMRAGHPAIGPTIKGQASSARPFCRSLWMRNILLCSLCALSLLLFACGPKPSTIQLVRGAASQYITAVQTLQAQTACDLTSPEVLQKSYFTEHHCVPTYTAYLVNHRGQIDSALLQKCLSEEATALKSSLAVVIVNDKGKSASLHLPPNPKLLGCQSHYFSIDFVYSGGRWLLDFSLLDFFPK